MTHISVESLRQIPTDRRRTEHVEHKGIGHPDTMCDCSLTMVATKARQTLIYKHALRCRAGASVPQEHPHVALVRRHACAKEAGQMLVGRRDPSLRLKAALGGQPRAPVSHRLRHSAPPMQVESVF